MSEPDIVCRITPWFWKRMGLMVLLFLVFTLWFYYDGKVKWPEENRIKATYDDFVENMLPEFDKLVGEEKMEMDAWKAHAGENGWADYLKEDGSPGKWTTYAATRGWPAKKPKGHTQSDIDGQFKWSAGCGVLAAVILVYLLLNLRKTIAADDEAYITPAGKRVLFSEIFEVDKRKWDDKGLAYIRYRGENGNGRVALDDLKYGGGEQILDRILENFEGDLIESVVEESGEAEATVEEKDEVTGSGDSEQSESEQHER